ncbi:hypothetical protein ASG63_08970 [Methylobacterium sp. Leaf94]|uniref:hypothetical protein n=1 Tax=Methylobacterium sp. Leaf94 TaxID=1736250 RepID=UPI0006FFCB0B|nr:hypothetical protein [Methylobacterium sp. Leaf94]KQU17628.1 hypothetical protein ASG63_08970 [Methylobacterium sp. Leaf94]
MTTNDEAVAKMVAARAAVEKAADDLLAHAEGIGLLAMVERSRSKADLREASLTPSLYLHGSGAWDDLFSRADEDARWETIKAAVALAGCREAYLRVVDVWTNPTTRMALRRAVEDVVGHGYGPPPPVRTVAEMMRDRYPEVSPAQVHDQGWRDHLA